jgi:DNA (cytosine-5)-methyltransferase 1
MLVSRGLGAVLGDLADLGFDAAWGVFRASAAGACHQRARLYLVAHSHGAKLARVDIQKPPVIDTEKSRRRQFARAIDAALPANDYASLPRDTNALARGMDGLKATGNGWVPSVATRAFIDLHSKLLADTA